MIKIYKGFDSTFTIPVTKPTQLYFVYPDASGSNFHISGSFTGNSSETEVYLTSAQTTNFTVGFPWMYAIIGDEPTLVDTVEIANIAIATETHNEKVLSALEAMIEGRASVEVQELQIGGRTLKYIPIADLLKLREYYKKAVETDKKSKTLGLNRQKINYRFR